MARADHTISPRILDSARQEFLAHGFEKASLKAICDRAGVTTGALYKRYRGKADLFRAVVADTVRDLYAMAEARTGHDIGGLSDARLMRAWDMQSGDMLWWFEFLHARREGFYLLLTCAEGTEYANFQHDWVEMMTDGTYAYYREAFRRGLTTTDISRAEFHILLTAFWSTIYEPFIHGYTWPQIEAHCALICRLFDWYAVLGFAKPEEKPSL